MVHWRDGGLERHSDGVEGGRHIPMISVVPELVQKNVVRRSVHSEHERELNEPLFQRLILELNLVHLGRKKRERSFF